MLFWIVVTSLVAAPLFFVWRAAIKYRVWEKPRGRLSMFFASGFSCNVLLFALWYVLVYRYHATTLAQRLTVAGFLLSVASLVGGLLLRNLVLRVLLFAGGALGVLWWLVANVLASELAAYFVHH